MTLARAEDAPGVLGRMRSLAPAPATVGPVVAEIVARVREGGDAELDACIRELDTAGRTPRPISISREEREQALADLDPAVRTALTTALANVTAVARPDVGGDTELRLEQGQRVLVRETPVRRAAIYVPGGRGAYPSTVVMGAATARVAGVEEVVVCSPPGREDGDIHPAVIGAAALCGVDEVLRMGGPHAIAALAYGTERVRRVDVIAGPGSLYVQEAKRIVSADVGIDGFHGPSDLLVLFDGAQDDLLALVALDLLAQAEHGPESLVGAVSCSEAALDGLAAHLVEAQTGVQDLRPTGGCALIAASDWEAAIAFAEAFAPEHLQLMGAGAERLAPRVRSAGCVFVGPASATAFGDYLAGSNHILPTSGTARFTSSLAPRHFRRRMAQVELGAAAAALAAQGAAVARAEGFERHARSMEARAPASGPTKSR